MVSLANWLKAEGLTYTALARRLKVKPDTVRRYCLARTHKDHRSPRAGMISAIFRETDGAVTPNDFHELPDISCQLSDARCQPNTRESAKGGGEAADHASPPALGSEAA